MATRQEILNHLHTTRPGERGSIIEGMLAKEPNLTNNQIVARLQAPGFSHLTRGEIAKTLPPSVNDPNARIGIERQNPKIRVKTPTGDVVTVPGDTMIPPGHTVLPGIVKRKPGETSSTPVAPPVDKDKTIFERIARAKLRNEAKTKKLKRRKQRFKTPGEALGLVTQAPTRRRSLLGA